MSKKETISIKQQEKSIDVSRRDVLLGIGAATLAYAGPASAAMKEHDHSKHSTQLIGLMDAVNACIDKGRRCISHCLVSFTEGDTELADCASKVQEMQTVCGGFAYLVASNSSYTEEYSRICEKVCRDCAKECRKHEKHIECEACANACDNIIDSIKLSFS